MKRTRLSRCRMIWLLPNRPPPSTVSQLSLFPVCRRTSLLTKSLVLYKSFNTLWNKMIKTDPWLPVDSLQFLYQLFDDLGTLPVRHELFSEQKVKDD
jgi:hypothetical protein